MAKAEAAAATGAATVTAGRMADIDLEIDGQADALLGGTTRQLMVDGSTEVIVPGVITMVVKAGAEAQALADRLAEARAASGRHARRAVSTTWPRLAWPRPSATRPRAHSSRRRSRSRTTCAT